MKLIMENWKRYLKENSTFPSPFEKFKCSDQHDTFYLMEIENDIFIHFTPPERAKQIIESGKLLMQPPYKKFGIDAVTAVSAVWGKFFPGVQTTHSKRGDLVAILFTTMVTPEVGYSEEVIWKEDVIFDEGAEIVSYEEAVNMLRDQIDFDGQVYYEIPKWCKGARII